MKRNSEIKFIFQVTMILSAFNFIFCLIDAAVAQTASQAMIYDQLGRLTQITYSGGVAIAFVYDAAGNRTSYTVTGSPNASPPAPTPVGQLKISPIEDRVGQKPD
jgi:YD repeat-containing protein